MLYIAVSSSILPTVNGLEDDAFRTFDGYRRKEPVDINEFLPERPFIVGEFSPACEAFKQVTMAGLAQATHYEYIQALQLVDLNWAILQRKASEDLELSNGTKHALESKLHDVFSSEERKKF